MNKLQVLILVFLNTAFFIGCSKEDIKVTNEYKPSLLKKVTNIDINNTGIKDIDLGSVEILSHGLADIDSFRLEGQGSSNFKINSRGKISTTVNTNLDCIKKKSYSLLAIAHNEYGDSDAVAVSIQVNCMDVPVFDPIILKFPFNYEGNITSFSFKRTGMDNNKSLSKNIKSIEFKENTHSIYFDLSSVPDINITTTFGQDKKRDTYLLRAINTDDKVGPYIEMTIYIDKF